MATFSQKCKSYPRDILNRKTPILKSALLNSPVASPSTFFSSSTFSKSVFLHHWWLFRPRESDGLAVSGFSSLGNQPVRYFESAAIAKRHDTTTLETIDGFTVTLTGFIDKSRSLDNGFPPEVYNRFLFGFPYNWKEYESKQCEPRKASEFAGSDASSCRVGNCFQPTFSEGDLSVTLNRDLLTLTFGESDGLEVRKGTLKDLSSNLGGTNNQKDIGAGFSRSRIDSEERSMDLDSSDTNDELPAREVVADGKIKDNKFKCKRGAKMRTDRSKAIDRQSNSAASPSIPIRITRSMTRMMKLKEQSETIPRSFQ